MQALRIDYVTEMARRGALFERTALDGSTLWYLPKTSESLRVPPDISAQEFQQLLFRAFG